MGGRIISSPGIEYSSPPTKSLVPWNFLVTNQLKTPAHPKYGKGSYQGYAINGIEGASLTLVRGVRYTFLVAASCSCPLVITTSSTGLSTSSIITST